MRHKKTPKRTIEEDAVYENKLIAKFINRLMKDGKKTIAQKLVYDTFSIIEKKGSDPRETFEKALLTVGPKVEVKARRVGGASYQVPSEVRGDRKVSLAVRWIIEAAKKRPSSEFKTFPEKLSAELMDAAENRGEAIKKRDNVLRMAEANRAFAHFRW